MQHPGTVLNSFPYASRLQSPQPALSASPCGGSGACLRRCLGFIPGPRCHYCLTVLIKKFDQTRHLMPLLPSLPVLLPCALPSFSGFPVFPLLLHILLSLSPPCPPSPSFSLLSSAAPLLLYSCLSQQRLVLPCLLPRKKKRWEHCACSFPPLLFVGCSVVRTFSVRLCLLLPLPVTPPRRAPRGRRASCPGCSGGLSLRPRRPPGRR